MQRKHNVVNSLYLKPDQLEKTNFDRYARYEQIKETEVITEAETELIDLLRNIEDDINFVMAAALIARTEKKTEVLIDFIEEYPEADAEEVMCFLVPGEDEDE